MTLRSRAIVMTLSVVWLPYITTRCIDPVSCPTEHVRQHDSHGDYGHQGHDGTPGEHGDHDGTPAPGTPVRTCCDLTGKLNIVVSAAAPSVTPFLVSAPLAISAVSAVLPQQYLRRDFVRRSAHGPPAYIRNHTLLV